MPCSAAGCAGVQRQGGGVPGVGFLEVPGAPERLGMQREILGADGRVDQRRRFLLGPAEVADSQQRPHHQPGGRRFQVGVVLAGPHQRVHGLAVLGVVEELRAASEFGLAGQRGSGLGRNGGHDDRDGGNNGAAQQPGTEGQQ